MIDGMTIAAAGDTDGNARGPNRSVSPGLPCSVVSRGGAVKKTSDLRCSTQASGGLLPVASLHCDDGLTEFDRVMPAPLGLNAPVRWNRTMRMRHIVDYPSIARIPFKTHGNTSPGSCANPNAANDEKHGAATHRHGAPLLGN